MKTRCDKDIALIVQSYKPTLPKPLTNNEKAQVAHFLSLRASIHEGPFYSVLGDNVRIGKSSTTAAATFDPFEGMPTYSQRYIKRRRKIPKLDSRPYGATSVGKTRDIIKLILVVQSSNSSLKSFGPP